MRILCTTDFSDVSINAIKWIVSYLDSIGGGDIEILHCLDLRTRGDMFLSIETLMREPAEKDMKELINKLNIDNSKINVSSNIVTTNPKNYIPKRAKRISADLIGIGTTGLTNLKNITIGSVTEYIVKHSSIPVLSIPSKSVFRNFNKIIIGADEELLKTPTTLDGVKKFIANKKVKIFIAQVYREEKEFVKLDDNIFKVLDDFDLEVEAIPFTKSISKSLNEFADKVNAQVMCIIHHKKNWFTNLFHHSIMKEELFNQDLPILIIPD